VGLLQFPFAALAALNCSAQSWNPASLNSTINDTFISPEAFSALPVGEPVSTVRVFNMRFSCTFPGGVAKVAGIGAMPTAGVTAVVVPGESNIFTTQQLSPLGLGYKFHWYTDQAANGNFCGPNWMTSATTTVAPGCYINMGTTSAAQTRVFFGELRLQFYKIGSIQDTGGNTITLPTPLTTTVATLFATDPSAPLSGTASYPVTWSTSTLTTAVRACTPLVDQTINFGTFTEPQSTTPGQVLASHPFTLNFTCPYAAFQQIGYVFQPVYGVHSATVMKLDENHSGIAQGVGIQIRPSGSGPYIEFNRPEAYYMAEFVMPDWIDPNHTRTGALTATREKSIDFTAELVRTNDPFAPGTIRSAVIIVMRYK